jgi:predicted AlkP superfamily phosphohydrolase/phosphomutase
MRRVVSLGLDGAAWHALDPMIEAGELPNLAKLVETGTRAPLRSVHPPVTCPAWRCSTAGKNPGKLGVYWWLTFDRSTGELYTPNSRSFQTADIWNYLSEAGLESAVINVPMTYPPEDIHGVLVSGFGVPFDLDVTESITAPPEMEDHIREEFGWQVAVDDVTAPDGPERVYDLIRSRFELLFELLGTGRYEYLHLTIFYINVLQHKYGNGPETKRAWRIIDEYLGELEEHLDAMDDEVLTVLYSDHGHSTIENTFVINQYLAENGYLSFREGTDGSFGERLYRGMKSLGLSPRSAATTMRSVLPEPVYDWLSPDYPVSTGAIAEYIDWERSTALAVSQGPVYLNRDRLGEDYRAVRDDLQREFEAVTHDGERVFDTVHDRDAIYSGDYMEAAPDLMVVPAEGWEVYGGITPSTFETRVTSWTSGNHPSGMLLLQGDGVAAGELGERSLLDVMPTVLRYLGCRVPVDVDGTAIEAPFQSGTLEPGWREPIQKASAGAPAADSSVRERLEGLGYLE